MSEVAVTLNVLTKNLRRSFEEDVRSALDKYKAAVDRRVCAEIDAGCCQTQRDREHRDKMQDAESEMEDLVATELFRIMTVAASHHKLGIL